MAGVDRLDQRMSYYSFARKSVRWWRKVFFWLVEVMVVNAYTLYIQNSAPAQRKISHKEFRRQLVLELCHDQIASTLHRQPHNHDQTLERLQGRHFPDESDVRRDFRVCSRRGSGGTRRLTKVVCSTCSDVPHLCLGVCFRKYHTEVNFHI